MLDSDRFAAALMEADMRLKALTDQDPWAAINAACELQADDVLNQPAINMIAAGTLIDAGAIARDRDAVTKGVRLLEELVALLPDRGDLKYCLANGLLAQADLVDVPQPSWFLATRVDRRRARNLYSSIGVQGPTPGISEQALTNLGNSLLAAFRFVEAYDSYSAALELDPTNGVALTGAAKALLHLVENGVGDQQVLLPIVAKHLHIARENPERIRQLAGEKALEHISTMFDLNLPAGKPLDLGSATEYERFVAENRLSLSPTIEGLDLSLWRWDSLRIHSVVEPIGSGSSPPPIFAIFNTLKADFLAARYLAYCGLNDMFPESGSYTDTLDYAKYGITSSVLLLAQRACLDLLDKVAVATSEYLGLPGNPQRISFANRWFEQSTGANSVRLQPKIQEEVSEGNSALIAITEVAGDIESGGFLRAKKELRNSATHRFAVLHDLGATSSRESPFVEHCEFDSFVNQLLETLRLTRAMIIYFVQMVMNREHRLHCGLPTAAPVRLPDHDRIRGRDAQ
ncbi:MAG: LA2681 family HEPN domain-containing protein [Cyanobacteriota bacterium]